MPIRHVLKPGTPGTPEQPGTARNTPEQSGTPRNTAEQPGTLNKLKSVANVHALEKIHTFHM